MAINNGLIEMTTTTVKRIGKPLRTTDDTLITVRNWMKSKNVDKIIAEDLKNHTVLGTETRVFKVGAFFPITSCQLKTETAIMVQYHRDFGTVSVEELEEGLERKEEDVNGENKKRPKEKNLTEIMERRGWKVFLDKEDWELRLVCAWGSRKTPKTGEGYRIRAMMVLECDGHALVCGDTLIDGDDPEELKARAGDNVVTLFEDTARVGNGWRAWIADRKFEVFGGKSLNEIFRETAPWR